MTTRNWISRALITFCFALVVFGRANAADSKTGHVVIPFDFWVQDTKLSAGTYEIQHLTSPTLVEFSRSDGQGSTEAFMLPVNDDRVTPSQAKLVFSLQNGQHYLYEVWGVYGRRIVTGQYGTAVPKGDSRVEVPVVYQ